MSTTDNLPPKEPGAGLWRTEEDDKFLANQEKIPPKSEQTDAVSQPIIQACLPPTDSYHTKLKERLLKIESELNSPEISAERLLQLQDEVEGMIPQNDETVTTQKATIAKINQKLQEKGGLWSKPLKENQDSPPSPIMKKAKSKKPKEIAQPIPQGKPGDLASAIDPRKVGPYELLKLNRQAEGLSREKMGDFAKDGQKSVDVTRKRLDARKLTTAEKFKQEMLSRWTLISLLALTIITASFVFATQYDVLKEQLSEHSYKAITEGLGGDPNALYFISATVGLFTLGVSINRPTYLPYRKLTLTQSEKEILEGLAKADDSNSRAEILKNATSAQLENIYHMIQEYEVLGYPKGTISKTDAAEINRYLDADNIAAFKYLEQEAQKKAERDPSIPKEDLKAATFGEIRNQTAFILEKAYFALIDQDLENLQNDLRNGWDVDCKDVRRAKIFIAFVEPEINKVLKSKSKVDITDDNIFHIAQNLGYVKRTIHSVPPMDLLLANKFVKLKEQPVIEISQKFDFEDKMKHFLRIIFGRGGIT